MSGLRRRPPRPFDLRLVDGDIIIDGREKQQTMMGARLTRAEVFALVKFAAELWPDQVIKVVSDSRPVGVESADLEWREWESINRARARGAADALQLQGVPDQAIDEPKEPREKHEAPNLDDLGIRRQDPEQEADHGDHQSPDGEQHASTVAELTGRVELLEAMHLGGAVVLDPDDDPDTEGSDPECGDVFQTADPDTAEALELTCSLPPGHSGDHSDLAGRNAWSHGGDDVE